MSKIKDLPKIVPCLSKSEAIGNKQQSASGGIDRGKGWLNTDPLCPSVALRGFTRRRKRLGDLLNGSVRVPVAVEAIS